MSLYGLKMVLRRDFAAKYIGNSASLSSSPQSNGVHPLFDWCVLGEFDHLSVEPIYSLPCVTQVDQLEYQDYTTGAVKQLMLFPCKNEQLAPWLEKLTTNKRFLLSASINLSPAALEGPDVFATDENVLGEVTEIIKQTLVGANRLILKTFGAPDYVVLFLADSLKDCVEIARSLEELAQVPIRRLSCHENDDGHLFTAIDNTFAFHSELDITTGDTCHDDAWFTFSLAVELGHTEIVSKKINDQSCQDVQLQDCSIEWKSPDVRGRFTNLSTLVTLWENVWFDFNFRQANLISTETHFCVRRSEPVPDLHSNTSQSSWHLAQPLYSELLDEIAQQIQGFANKFLEPPQKSELLDTFRLFRCCFFRPELIGGAKDLLPFFRQLGRSLSLHSYWEKFLARPADASAEQKKDETVLTEFTLLLEYAGRAVRNRIEHKAGLHDVPTPYTVENGACKLVGAYSVVMYLCWEIFRRLRGGISPEHATANDFGACVYFGADGRVTVRELFTQFRLFVEDEEHWDGTASPPLSPQKTTWTARLFALNISGLCLSRPEEMLVHFLHEVAEISEWIEISRARQLRDQILDYTFHAVGMHLDSQARRQAASLDQPPSIESTAFSVATIYAAAQLANDSKISYARLHPEEYPVKLAKCYAEALQEPNSLTEHTLEKFNLNNQKRNNLSDPKPPYKVPLHASSYFSLKGEYREKFESKCESLKFFTREIVADIGMVAGFHTIKSFAEGPDGVSLGDVCKIFSSLLKLYEETRSDVVAWVRNAETIVRRWSIHARAAERNGENWQDAITKSVAKLTASKELRCMTTDDLQKIFNSPDKQPGLKKLVTDLKGYSFYGGSKSLNFLGGDDLSPSEKKLLLLFMKTWRSNTEETLTQNRIQLLFDLWAKSLRIKFDKSLSKEEPKCSNERQN